METDVRNSLRERIGKLVFLIEWVPGVCTARWTREDWERWESEQKRLRFALGVLTEELVEMERSPAGNRS